MNGRRPAIQSTSWAEKQSAEDRKRVLRKGWVRGYDLIFTPAFKIAVAEDAVPISVLEDIVLTRSTDGKDVREEERPSCSYKRAKRRNASSPATKHGARASQTNRRASASPLSRAKPAKAADRTRRPSAPVRVPRDGHSEGATARRSPLQRRERSSNPHRFDADADHALQQRQDIRRIVVLA